MKKIIIALALILTTSSSWAWELTTNSKGNNIWQHTYNDGATIIYRPNKDNYKLTLKSGARFFGSSVNDVMRQAKINRRAQGDHLWETNLVSQEVKDAWKLGYTGKDVNINVIDNFNNPTIPSYIPNWYRPLDLTISHGDRVSSLIQGEHSHSFLGRTTKWIGVAPHANVTKTQASQYRDNMFRGYDIVNISRGSTYYTTLDNAGSIAAAAGDSDTLVVTSAGNHGESCLITCDALNLGLKNTFNDKLLVVGGIDSNNNISAISNKAGILQDNYVVDLFNPISEEFGQGTSFSAPLVSGKAALIKSKFKNINASQLANIIKTTADDLGEPGVDNIYGHGRINLSRALTPIGQLN